MATKSAAEARFDARVRPGIAASRPPRRRPTSASGARQAAVALRPAGAAPRPLPGAVRPQVHGDPYAIIRPAPASRRLTRRGRLVVAMMVTVCAVAVISALWLGLARGADAASGVSATRSGGQNVVRVVVKPGQTLWVIAAQQDPAADPRVVIGEIIQVNALRGNVIQPGQVLWVPRA